MAKKKNSKFDFKAGKSIVPDPQNEIEILDTWQEDLIWCPSQCYLTVKHRFDTYSIYLRWRHDDPWTCRLLKKVTNDEIWSKIDLFEKYGKFWRETDKVKDVEASAVECVRLYLIEGYEPEDVLLPPTI